MKGYINNNVINRLLFNQCYGANSKVAVKRTALKFSGGTPVAQWDGVTQRKSFRIRSPKDPQKSKIC